MSGSSSKPRGRGRSLAPRAIALALLALLALLATLQSRWIEEVSRADEQRRKASLAASTRRFADDLDRELTRTSLMFRPRPGPVEKVLAERLELFTTNAPYPLLVKALFVTEPGSEDVTLRRFHRETSTLTPVAWPEELREMKARLAVSPATDPPERPRIIVVAGPTPAFALPLAPASADDDARSSAGSDRPAGHVVVLLDGSYLTAQIVPRLFTASFGAPEASEWVASVEDAGSPGRPLWVSDPEAARGGGPVELTSPLFWIRAFDELRGLEETLRGQGRPPRPIGGEPGPPREGRPPPREGEPPPPRDGLRPRPRLAEPPFPRLDPAWRLSLVHRDGSLEAAVTKARRRNLAVSLGVLALLAASLALLVETTRRERSLARQQMEFVAGVSHEMHTPLAAIRSAAQNLADGIVADPAQVQRYGGLINAEGRRLSNLLGEALEMAGIQSGRKLYRHDPIEVDALFDAALADCGPLLSERGTVVERNVARDVPRISGDADSLARAVRNLVENAVKYGGEERWLGLRASGAEGGRQVRLEVRDRGAGVSRADRPHVFTPFFRGRATAEAGMPGSGLGLAIVKEIVEAHGGRVEVTSGNGPSGSVFVVHLPAATAKGAAS